MFTGIVEAVGTLVRFEKRGHGAIVEVETPASFNLAKRVRIGDSIANNGVCLTVTSINENSFVADVSAETCKLTCFKNYTRGTKFNLELACTPATHLGGHIMQGHVDGIGEVIKLSKLDDAIDIWVQVPHDLMRYIAYKGSIAVDGVSLTVNELADDSFRLTLIPHTQDSIGFISWSVGSQVNVEVDVLSRYLERLLLAKNEDKQQPKKDSGVSMQSLLENGFI